MFQREREIETETETETETERHGDRERQTRLNTGSDAQRVATSAKADNKLNNNCTNHK